jgi:hypothetical protein
MAFTYDNWPRSVVKDGERKYVGNPAEMKKHLNGGWMLPQDAGYQAFPKALHGPEGTSVRIPINPKDDLDLEVCESELARAIAAGWSLTQIHDEEPEEQTVEAPHLDPFKPPPVAAKAKAKRGRPAVN